MAIIPTDHKIEDTPKVKFKNIRSNTPFSGDYKEKCFRIWYNEGQPSNAVTLDILPEDKYGRTPSFAVIASWRRGINGWVMRARKLDEEARKRTDEIVVRERADMFVQHALAGAELVELGLNYLEENGITSDSVAIKAIKQGTDLERRSLGIAELLKKIATMSDSQLEKRAQELADASDDDNIIDAQFEERGND